MAIEKAKQKEINLLYLLLSILKNISVAPISVESPAIVDTNKGISDPIYLTYSKYIKKRSIYV